MDVMDRHILGMKLLISAEKEEIITGYRDQGYDHSRKEINIIFITCEA